MEMKYVVPDMAQSFGTLEFAGESEPVFERDKNNRRVLARRSYNLYSDVQKGENVGLCICALTGCGASPNEKPDTSNPIVNSNTNEENTNGSSENKGNDILESANLRGSVLEFTDNGCLVNQAKDIEGGAGIKIEAPGMENKDNAVSVTYNPDCEFVIATVNAQSGVTNVTTGSISDVKKQSEVYLYGEFADTLHFNATKVVIARWE